MLLRNLMFRLLEENDGEGGGDAGAGGSAAEPELTPDELAAKESAEALAVINAGIDEADGKPAGSKPDADVDGDEALDDDDAAGGEETEAERLAREKAEADAAAGKPPEGETDDERKAREKAEADAAAAAGTETTEQKREREKAELVQALDLEKNPLPADTNERTKSRLELVIGVNKTLTDSLEEVVEQRDALWNQISKTGTTPEQFGEHMTYLENFNSDDPKSLEAALKVAQEHVAELSKAIGKPVPGTDPLDGFEDLQKEVELGDISKERAIELADARRAKEATSTRSRQTDDQKAYSTAVATARDELNALEVEMQKANKAEYDAKKPFVTAIVKSIAKNTHPTKWAQAFKDAYANIEVPKTNGRAPAARVGGRPDPNRTSRAGSQAQPLRNKTPAGGGTAKEPGSLEEAINAGIEAGST